jgi:(p)ppGpp synthase/HD superfamily hydrolase
MYQDRIFAFTPTGELIQLPKGATPIDFAYAVHTDLGNQVVGAKVNGRLVPLRTPIENGDQVQILKSAGQQPQPEWLNFVVTAKARAALRRSVRVKERDEMVALGRKFYDEIVASLPAPLAPDALANAIRRLRVNDEAALMEAIARRSIDDAAVTEALMPGAGEATRLASRPMPRRDAVSIRGLTPGVSFQLADCCHPVPGDRIVGLRHPDAPVEVHAIDCPKLAAGTDDADWVDLAWGDKSDGGTARLSIVLRNQPGALGEMASIFGTHAANILNLSLTHRDGGFHTFVVDLEVHDLGHLMRILAALRSIDSVSSAERVRIGDEDRWEAA